MGMSVNEFECMTYHDLSIKIEGFNDAKKREESIQRMIGFCAFIAPHINPKKAKFEEIWPSLYSKKEAFNYDEVKDVIKEAIKRQKEEINGKA